MLGIEAPWKVEDVELDVGGGEVVVHLVIKGKPTCAECGETAPGYDARERRWRHLDTKQFRTILAAKVLRTKCETHGVLQFHRGLNDNSLLGRFSLLIPHGEYPTARQFYHSESTTETHVRK